MHHTLNLRFHQNRRSIAPHQPGPASASLTNTFVIPSEAEESLYFAYAATIFPKGAPISNHVIPGEASRSFIARGAVEEPALSEA
jgi:hypothetical protein